MYLSCFIQHSSLLSPSIPPINTFHVSSCPLWSCPSALSLVRITQPIPGTASPVLIPGLATHLPCFRTCVSVALDLPFTHHAPTWPKVLSCITLSLFSKPIPCTCLPPQLSRQRRGVFTPRVVPLLAPLLLPYPVR